MTHQEAMDFVGMLIEKGSATKEEIQTLADHMKNVATDKECLKLWGKVSESVKPELPQHKRPPENEKTLPILLALHAQVSQHMVDVVTKGIRP